MQNYFYWPTTRRSFGSDLLKDFFSAESSPERFDYRPNFHVEEHENSFQLIGELPGFTKSDVSIEVNDNQLVIKGKRKVESKKNQEYFSSSFTQSYQLSDDLNSDEIKANLEDGILKLSLPKTQKVEQKRTIAIS